MLDNFDGAGLKTAAASLKKRWGGRREVLLECSGGLTEANVAGYINNGEQRQGKPVTELPLTKLQISISSQRVRSIKAYHMLTFL